MGELINGRTAEDIKSALLRCGTYKRCHSEENDDCPYYVDCLIGIRQMKLIKDALALIKRLESERDAALAKMPRCISVEERLPEESGYYLYL